MYSIYLFDLDGTITDSEEGITKSVEYALNKWNIEVADRSELRKFIGPPLTYSFMTYYGFSAEDAKKAVDAYREYYSETGIFENRVYDGIEDVFKELIRTGKKIVLATSKPEIFANRILEHFGLSEYFDFTAGAVLDVNGRNKKDEIITYALENISYKDKSEIIMIGDRRHDILGAKVNGIASVGVLYGFGDRAELEEAGADYIIERPEEILNID